MKDDRAEDERMVTGMFNDPIFETEVTKNAGHEWRFVVEMSAATQADLAMKLEDIAYDITMGRLSRRSVFAAPSCSGLVEMYEAKS